ncbi:hypothetical protein A2X44_03350 [candidate division CPR3 bacterium GWF2_35_18]|uniref:Glycosyltransferase RgtA/B/C/D-like domain-containing protein n=1 Tax=candidate division CPR3 bacterium GW2011_GWF2_35_18 TaxID=1618350 RepID=A0A0G0BJB1_UNCC3|nr:MAG: hypothetical protein UR67_C0005G0032 [candidate division CPR3 bacterium GW2011_GWF2_35_18]OGB63015.1 MAG: hypothetical protein A2X44_03350 [candidate division CPR3 bacterium GWF2_35_18]OGB63961.1 MAG: hypothetical protein A2250_02855 [candidate division CPR3 bacterium RIFOXYA2_FULL_35_13]OGB78413.1 MAG: hypothetical protein A2296_03535 [candidate division CPR3 bacterium RIFOXYB2_FULL_35_8]
MTISILIIILLLTFPGLLLLGFLVDKQKFDKLLISLVPFLSLSFYAILFFVYSKMAIPFRLQTVLISFCVVLVFYLLFKYRQLGFVLQSLKNSSFHFSKDWIFVIIPTLILLLVQIYTYYGNPFPLPADDTTFHYSLVKKITETGFGFERFYPFGLHAFVALIHQVTNYPIEKNLNISTILIVSMMPISLYLLTNTVFKNRRISLLTAFVSPLFSLFPVRPSVWGGLSFLWGITFMWQYLAVFIKTLHTKSLKLTVLTLFLGLGLFFIHSPEFFMTLIFVGIYFLTQGKKLIKWQNISLLLLQVLLIFVIQRLIQFRGVDFVLSTLVQIQINTSLGFGEKINNFFSYWLNYFFILVNIVFPVFIMTGLTQIKKNYRQSESSKKPIIFVIFSFLLVLFIYIDVVFVNLFGSIYNLFFPLFDIQRITEFMIFSSCVMAAFGLNFIWEWFKKTPSVFLKSLTSYLILTFSIVTLIVEAVVFRTTMFIRTPEREIFAVYDYFQSQEILPETMILNDIFIHYLYSGGIDYRSSDFVDWIGILTEIPLTFPYKGLQSISEDQFQNRYTVLSNLDKLKEDSSLQQIVKENHLQYFVWDSKLQPMREHTFSIAELQQNEALELSYVTHDYCLDNYNEEGCIFVFKFKDF